MDVNLLPVGITYDPWPQHLDEYRPQEEKIRVAVAPPIDYDDAYMTYLHADNHEARRQALRAPIDMAMCAIARTVGLPYIDERISLRQRTTIILESGEEVPIDQIDTQRLTPQLVLRYNTHNESGVIS